MKKKLISKSEQNKKPRLYNELSQTEKNKLLKKAKEINEKAIVENPFCLPPDYNFNSNHDDPADTSNMGEDLDI